MKHFIFILSNILFNFHHHVHVSDLHGVIGEHRRSSRSSSVSSGGSSGNNTDAVDAARQGALGRLPSVSQADVAPALEGTAQQVLQQLDMDAKEPSSKENGVVRKAYCFA